LRSLGYAEVSVCTNWSNGPQVFWKPKIYFFHDL
jgi:hypothetical protein